jgi:2'-5' RNA ligase
MANMYFIALVAPKEINEAVLKWKQFMKERFDCSVALRSPAHVTLVPPFWMKEEIEIKLKDSIENFSQQQSWFELNLVNFSAFKPRVIYVDVQLSEALNKLHFELYDSLVAVNLFPIEKEERPFHPHVTIATRDLSKRSFREAWEIFKDKEYKATWIANSISLLRHNQKNWDVVFTSQFQK